jgi:hypothetical protein
LTFFKPGIAAINEVQATVVTGPHERLVFPELQGVERASISPKHNPHDDSMFVLLLPNSNNLCRNECHCVAFNACLSPGRTNFSNILFEQLPYLLSMTKAERPRTSQTIEPQLDALATCPIRFRADVPGVRQNILL